jgi:hypothetical protein
MPNRLNFSFIAPALFFSAALVAGPLNIADLRREFEHPPDNARIMMRWWWFGPAVSKPELERELRVMKAGGIGGVEVQSVYPLALDDPASGIKNFPYLSEEFLDALRFTSVKAAELGLRMDMTLGSGWPYGGPHIPVHQAAGKIRIDRVRVGDAQRRIPIPSISEGEKLLAVFNADGSHELTDIHDGAVWLSGDKIQAREILFFIASRTGMMVKRPSIGAEGFVLDHYDRSATLNHLQTAGDRIMKALGSRPPYAVFCDSLEVYGNDWTGDFLAEFRKRRGYDLKPHLPALTMNSGANAAAIRHDWGKTLTELFNDRFLTTVHDWAKLHHSLFRLQGYGMPPATVSSYTNADLPEGEGFLWKSLSATRWASSASHLYGKPVTSSETWTWLHSPVFRATPLDMKAEADLHFLQGINQLIGHGWPYTPEKVEYPGWRFYAAAAFGEKNPWWIVMPEISAYLQRVSFLLRQGTPANDVAVYLPDSDAWAQFSPGKVSMIEALRQRLGPDIVARILEAGYNFDFFDDAALAQIGRVEKGALTLGGNRYRIVVMPGVESMPLVTLQKMEEFAKSGGILMATRRTPSIAPGFLASAADHAQVLQTSDRLFKGRAAPGHFVEDEANVGSTLTKLLRPDVQFAPAAPDVGFVHRTSDTAEIYFIVNTSNEQRIVDATFRAEASEVELWDPVSGRSEPAGVIARPSASVTTISLDLEPYASRVVVFHKGSLRNSQITRTLGAASTLDISSGWKVTFGEHGKAVTMDKLKSWTDDEDTRFYSGVATYEKTVSLAGGFVQNGSQVTLNFGEGTRVNEPPSRAGMRALLEAPVREAAVIYVNGKRAGAIWCPPYRLDITEWVKPADNRIRMEVANLATNYMAGRALPNYRLLNLRYGVRFEAQDMDKIEALPAGVLGPVRLVAVPGVR